MSTSTCNKASFPQFPQNTIHQGCCECVGNVCWGLGQQWGATSQKCIEEHLRQNSSQLSAILLSLIPIPFPHWDLPLGISPTQLYLQLFCGPCLLCSSPYQTHPKYPKFSLYSSAEKPDFLFVSFIPRWPQLCYLSTITIAHEFAFLNKDSSAPRTLLSLRNALPKLAISAAINRKTHLVMTYISSFQTFLVSELLYTLKNYNRSPKGFAYVISINIYYIKIKAEKNFKFVFINLKIIG